MHTGPLHDPLSLTVVSCHRTSEGVVSYLRCGCGAWEVRTAGPHGAVTTLPRSVADTC
ncbi:hypothetical protein ACWGH8_16845 [Nonomuraea muscovyensis]|jgi:hypothetical protein|uniref:Uncharacterized protein n=1 Tax=Nonomuraea muscovyensis TaxID=1124761 RepID=A0A7X0BWW0_9ACTN|nr:hypothetical protein [Nonomuraea muscovyensis]MBB6343636.1 hypothetical protein [Nonomuraea muscovyensis]MDF2707074.1 hypothetical protein [Nonomuraea muscovyensis]